MSNNIKINIDERLKKLMSNTFCVSVDKIDDDTSQGSLDLWDSLKHMNLIIALEEEFEIEFDENEINELLNFKLIKMILETKIEN